MAASCGVPERAHVREVPFEAAAATRACALGHGCVGAEAVGDDDVVVVDGGVRCDRVGRRVERHQGGGGLRVGRHGVAGRVDDADAAVDGDEGVAAEDDLVGELGDGDGGARVVEGRHLGRQVAAGVGPGRSLAVVDAEAVVLEEPAGTVLDDEGPAEAGDDAVVVSQPPDGRRGAVGTGEGVGVDVEVAAVGGGRAGAVVLAAAREHDGTEHDESDGDDANREAETHGAMCAVRRAPASVGSLRALVWASTSEIVSRVAGAVVVPRKDQRSGSRRPRRGRHWLRAGTPP